MNKYELAIAWGGKGDKDVLKFLNDGWEPFHYVNGSFFFRRLVDVGEGEHISDIRERPLLCMKTKIPCQMEDEFRLGELEDVREEQREFDALEREREEKSRLEAAMSYSDDSDGSVDDHTSVWGMMGGPDCRTQPVKSGSYKRSSLQGKSDRGGEDEEVSDNLR